MGVFRGAPRRQAETDSTETPRDQEADGVRPYNSVRGGCGSRPSDHHVLARTRPILGSPGFLGLRRVCHSESLPG